MSNGPKPIRVVTNEDVKKYNPMVNKYIRDSVIKNWNESQGSKKNIEPILGNTGWTLNDIRQHLLTEVVVALQKYNPDYRTKEGASIRESTFVFTHLFNRTGQLMKRLTSKRYGYGLWSTQIERVLGDVEMDE